MYRSGLVPQRWCWLGLIGGPLIIITGTAILFGGNHPSSTIALTPRNRDHPRRSVGTLPRRLLHHLGLQPSSPILQDEAREDSVAMPAVVPA